MAKSPFATSGNVGDIAPVSLKGGFTPSTGIADAVVNVANIAIPAIVQNLEDEITDDVSGKIEAVSLALQATRYPSLHDTIFSKEALDNPNVQLALKEFTLIQDAATAGRLPQTFALERLELVQNDAIRRSPEFESEIRGAMLDATGQDPSKTLFKQLISTATKRQSGAEKAQEQLQIQAIKLGTTIPKVIAMNQAAAQNQIAQQSYDLSAKQGTYNLNIMSKDVASQSAEIVTNTMAEVHAMVVAGDVFDVNTKRNLIARVDAAFGAANQSLLTRMTGVNVSGTAIQAQLAPLIALRDNTIKMIEDNTMQKILKEHNNVIIDSTISNVLNNDQFGSIYALAGERGLLDYMKWMEKAGGTAEGKALVSALNDDARIGFDLNNIGREYTKIGSGEEPVTKQAKQERVIAAGIALSTPDMKPEFQLVALEEIRKHGGQELAWSSFNSNKVMQATAQSNPLKAAFINMQVTTTAGLSSELLQLAANPEIPVERLEINEAGQLQIKKVEGFGTVGRDARLAEGKLTTFVNRFNRANAISAKYNGAGILPSARYSNTQNYWDTVKSAASDVVKDKGKSNAVRKVVRGSDGKLIFDGGT